MFRFVFNSISLLLGLHWQLYTLIFLKLELLLLIWARTRLGARALTDETSTSPLEFEMNDGTCANVSERLR